MKSVLFFLVCTVFIFGIVMAAPFDTGFIEWMQPDGTKFIARAWGDSYISCMETSDGYRFVRHTDSWYYYAELNWYGEFSPTKYRVAIDEPPEISYKLERSQSRIEEIERFISGKDYPFPRDSLLPRYKRLQAQANAQERPLTIRVNVLLVEFQDVRHYDPDEYPRLGGYLKSDFDSMLFSQKFWYAPKDSPQYTSPHPEGDWLYGSFTDYWDQMSLGKFRIEGRIVNPEMPNGVPQWMTLADSQSFYGGSSASDTNFDRLFDSAFARAVSYGWLTPADTSNDTIKYIIVYAGPSIWDIVWCASG